MKSPCRLWPRPRPGGAAKADAAPEPGKFTASACDDVRSSFFLAKLKAFNYDDRNNIWVGGGDKMKKSLIVNKAMEDYPLLREENYVTSPCPICNNSNNAFTICNKDAAGFPAKYVICKKCGNIFFSRIPSKEGYILYYNKVYDSLTERRFKNYTIDEDEHISAFIKNQKKQGVKIADYCDKYLFGGLKILDLGCGMGGTLKVFQDRYGADCYGIEPAAEQVRIARDILGVENIYCGVAEDIEDIFDHDVKFDLIIIKATIDHFYKPSLVLNLLRNYCHDKTMLFNSAREYKKSLTINRCRSVMEHTTTFTSFNLVNLLNVTGFSDFVRFDIFKEPVYNQIWSLSRNNEPKPYKNYFITSLGWLLAGTVLSVVSKIK